MPTMLTGVVSDFTILSNQRVVDMEPVIAQLEPEEAPLITLLMKLSGNSRDCYSQTFEWLEDENNPRYAKAAGAFTNVATSITMTSPQGLFFKAGDYIHDEQTGEKMLVTASTVTSLTVTRGQQGTTGLASGGAADGLVRMGTTSQEGALIPVLKQTQKVRQFNYAEILRSPFGFTETLKASKLYGQGDVMGYEANKQSTDHKRMWENKFFLGTRFLDTSGAQPQAFTGGLSSFITTNVQTTASLTQVAWETFLLNQSRFGSNRKLAIVAPIIMSALASWPANRLAPPDPDTTTSWGVSIAKYRASNGFTVDVVEHRDWLDFTAGSASLGGSCFILDMDMIKRRVLRGTRLLPKRAGNDEDSDKQEFLTEQGIAVMQERRHAILKGVTGYAP
jgi:hypothetical protein